MELLIKYKVKEKRKTKLLTINTKTTADIWINNTRIKILEEFTYLYSIVSNTVGIMLDIQKRIKTAK